ASLPKTASRPTPRPKARPPPKAKAATIAKANRRKATRPKAPTTRKCRTTWATAKAPESADRPRSTTSACPRTSRTQPASMRILPTLFLSALLAASALAQAERVIVFPVEAIADSARMSKEEFRETYPGIDLTGFGLSDEGWYVKSRHEPLNYLYGPIYDLEEARRYKALMEEVRLTLVLKQPKLSTSTVELIEFRFNPADAAAASKPAP